MKSWMIALFCMLTLALPVRGEWKEPEDGKLTEKQVTQYISAMKEMLQMYKAAGKALEGSNTGIGGMAAVLKASEKSQAIITKHGFSDEEFSWVGTKITEAWPTAMLQRQWDEQSKPELEKQLKKNQDEQTALKQRITDLEAASKTGNRVLTKEQRQEAVARATQERDSIKEEITSKDAEIKQATEEAAAKDKEAGDADKNAKNPPKEVNADDRESYIEEQKGIANTAREAAKDIRESNLAERKKEREEITKRLAAAEKKIASPEATADEDKEQVKKENEEALTRAKNELETTVQAEGFLKETLETGRRNIDQMAANTNPANIELFKKHMKAWEEAMGMNQK